MTPPFSWCRLQAVSGFAFGMFFFLHVLTIAAAGFDLGAFDDVLDHARFLYRPVEGILVLLPLVLHLLAGGVRAFERDRRLSLVRLSGMVLALMMVGHVLHMRLLPMVSGFGADGSYVSYAVEVWPWLAIPALSALSLLGILHVVTGTMAGVQEFGGFRDASEHRLRVTMLTWGIILMIALSPGVGRLILERGNADPSFYPTYQRMFEKYLPMLKPRNPRAS